MAEGALKSYNPLAYYVNNISDFDPEVVKAHRNKDKQRQSELLRPVSGDRGFDVFICVNKHGHASVLCAPSAEEELFKDMISDDPFMIPDILLCWRYELCFEHQDLRMYKIKKTFAMFKDIKPRTEGKSYFIARYKNVHPLALQFAALRAAPHRYNALLSDCVEFSKEFCVSLLSYCDNWKEIQDSVDSRIKEASATGLSVEKLSRKYRASGWLGNLSLGGTDVTSMLSQKRVFVVAALLLLVLVYPVVVAVLIKWYL